MPSLEQWVRCMTLLYAGSASVLAIKLWHEGLHRRYKFFLWFLVADALHIIALLSVPYHTNLYAWVYFASEPLIAIFYCLIVLEMYELVLQDYPGIAALSRWMLRFIFPLAILLSLGLLSPGLRAGAPSYPILQTFLVVQRTVVFTVLIFLVLIELFLFWYPLSLSRNTLLYCVGYLVFFTSQTAGLGLVSVIGIRLTPLANLLTQAVSCGCLLFWLFALRATGELNTVLAGVEWRPGEKERMRQQLLAFNKSLFRIAGARKT